MTRLENVQWNKEGVGRKGLDSESVFYKIVILSSCPSLIH